MSTDKYDVTLAPCCIQQSLLNPRGFRQELRAGYPEAYFHQEEQSKWSSEK
jgi:hypothetical protein